MPCQLFAYCVVSGNTNVEKSFQEIYNDDSMFIVIINVYIPNRRLDSLRNTLRLARYCSSMMLLCISKKFKENNSVTTCISSAYNIMLILEQGYYHFFFNTDSFIFTVDWSLSYVKLGTSQRVSVIFEITTLSDMFNMMRIINDKRQVLVLPNLYFQIYLFSFR